tara:strand:+ start:347 stop:1183 length:837 start_codon:yes stop_codon:yes gene_type:complete
MGFVWVSAFTLFKRCWLSLMIAFIVGVLVLLGVGAVSMYLVTNAEIPLVDLPVSLDPGYRDIGMGSLAQLQSLHTGLSPALRMTLFTLSTCAQLVLMYLLLDIAMCKLYRKPVAIWHSLVFICHRLHWVLLGALLSALVVMLSAFPLLGLVYVIPPQGPVGLLFFALLYIPVLYMSVCMLFVNYFVIYDRYFPWHAIVASIALVKGNWWRVFALFMVPSFIAWIVYFIVLVVFSNIGVAFALALVSILIFAMLGYTCCLYVCIYQDLLARRDTKEIEN